LGPWATANYCRAGIKSLRGTLAETKIVAMVNVKKIKAKNIEKRLLNRLR
jgi:hypothetical protein